MAQSKAQMQADPKIYIPIERVDDEKRMAYGYGHRGDLVDSFGTIIDLDSVKRCLPDYKKWRNVREMHEPSAVGRADEITVDEKGVYLGVYVGDDQAWRKVKDKIYRGFSIGGKKDYQENERLYLKRITEFSLVDRPSNDGCEVDEFRMAAAADEMNPTNLLQNNHDGHPSTGQEGGETRMSTEKKEEVKAGEAKVVAPAAAKVERSAEEKAADEAKDVQRAAEVTTFIKRYSGEEISDAQTAAYALSSIAYLYEKEKGESHPEAAEQIAQLMAVIENLKKFIASEIMEDDAEVSVTLAAGKTDDVARGGAEISKKNQAKLQIIHDHVATMGATCKGANVQKAAGEGDDVQRIAALETEVGTLKADVTRMEGELKTKDEEIKRLAAIPEAPKGALKVVSKEADAADAEVKRLADEAEVKRIEGLPKDQQAVELIKRSHQQPQIFRVR
jgi:hypothetical protein